MSVTRGRQFLAIPGPTNVPLRILQALDRPPMDFTTPEFAAVAEEVQLGLRRVFKTENDIFVWASTGHGAWEGAIANFYSPGEKVLICETGSFSEWWKEMAELFGLEAEYLPGDWRQGIDPDQLEERLRADTNHEIKGIGVVHNETSTGLCNDLAAIRKAIDAAGHPALLMVDTISSLASMDFRMDEWGCDVVVGGSQKGLMQHTGLGLLGVSPKALKRAETATSPRRYWDIRRSLQMPYHMRNPGTAPAHFFYGLREAINFLEEETLDGVFARHARLAEGVRRAIAEWAKGGAIDFFVKNEARRSNSVTAVEMTGAVDTDTFRFACRDDFNVFLGGGLLQLGGKVFRIGHLGDLNEPMVWGTLAAIEATFKRKGIPHGPGGVDAAIAYLAS
jgi:alanine-glyoxylate transaminase/serine-glyoxylate transaminase/serine-pyruvate transaminase